MEPSCYVWLHALYHYGSSTERHSGFFCVIPCLGACAGVINENDNFCHASLLIMISKMCIPPCSSYVCSDIDIDVFMKFKNISKRNSKCISIFFHFWKSSIKLTPYPFFLLEFHLCYKLHWFQHFFCQNSKCFGAPGASSL